MRARAIGTALLGLGAVLGSQAFGSGVTVQESRAEIPALPEGADPAYAVADLPASAVHELALRLHETSEPEVSDAALTGVVRRYCVVCHNDQLQTANLSLQEFDVADPVDSADRAEKVIHKLHLDMMPPPGMPRPGGDTLQLLVQTLEEKLDRAAADEPDPGVRRFQRMTRSEYERAVRDLLSLEVDAQQWLPADIYLGSYDTWADLQQLSGLVVEAYMTAAAEISRLALGDPSAPPRSTDYGVAIEQSQHAWDHVDGAPFGTRGGTVVMHNFPADGNYVFEVKTVLGAGAELEDIDISVDGEQVGLLAIPHGRGGDRGGGSGIVIETEPVFVEAGQRKVAAAFVRRNDGPYQDLLTPHDWSFAGGERNTSWANYGVTNLPHLTELTITGPFEGPGTVANSLSRERIFSCYPAFPEEERPCAESIVERFATEAYRRPVTGEDLAGLIAFYDRGHEEGGFETGIRMALQGVLSSPSFIFRLEEEPAGLAHGENYVLSDVDLASRLSFFLWGTLPDRELLEVAEQGRLTEPDVLEAQVRRMLEDPRSEALATRFASQWLRLAAIEGKQPLHYWYPDFSLDLMEAMRRETEVFFDYLVRKDRSFLELFTADYTFVNERLARHYGIPYTGGTEFRRVQQVDPYRRGILGHGSILTLTSMPNRTSPVKRGEWVMEVLLGSPPPPPPPNVPELDATEDVADGRFLTTRERMEIHRQNPSCNSCHQFIDPIGLALDHFDVVGQRRVREARMPLDTRGEYYDGTVISTPTELADALLKRPEPLVRTFTENLLAYAIGRQLDYKDRPAVRAISMKAERDAYRMSSFILGVVESDQFRLRKVDVVADDADQESD